MVANFVNELICIRPSEVVPDWKPSTGNRGERCGCCDRQGEFYKTVGDVSGGVGIDLPLATVAVCVFPSIFKKNPSISPEV